MTLFDVLTWLGLAIILFWGIQVANRMSAATNHKYRFAALGVTISAFFAAVWLLTTGGTMTPGGSSFVISVAALVLADRRRRWSV